MQIGIHHWVSSYINVLSTHSKIEFAKYVRSIEMDDRNLRNVGMSGWCACTPGKDVVYKKVYVLSTSKFILVRFKLTCGIDIVDFRELVEGVARF